MSYQKSNAAYDLSNFMPEDNQEEDVKKKAASKKRSVKKQNVSPAVVVKWVFVSLFIMLSLASIMVGNVRINQYNDEIAQEQKNLNTQQSLQVSLNAKLEARMSIQKVEDYAVNQLGLVKVQPYQIEYVNITDKDKVQVGSNNFDIIGFFKGVINSIVVYFS